MKIGTKGRYALMSMIQLAKQEQLYNISDISKSQQISYSYLEQIFRKIKSANLIKSYRGRKGGYVLAIPASEITVADIMEAVEESIDFRKCQGLSGKCSHATVENGKKVCNSHCVWDRFNEYVKEFLTGITLQDVVDEKYPTYLLQRTED